MSPPINTPSRRRGGRRRIRTREISWSLVVPAVSPCSDWSFGWQKERNRNLLHHLPIWFTVTEIRHVRDRERTPTKAAEEPWRFSVSISSSHSSGCRFCPRIIISYLNALCITSSPPSPSHSISCETLWHSQEPQSFGPLAEFSLSHPFVLAFYCYCFIILWWPDGSLLGEEASQSTPHTNQPDQRSHSAPLLAW